MSHSQPADRMGRPVSPPAALALSVLLWSLTGLLIKVIPWDGWSLAFGRNLLGVAVLAVLLRRKLRRTQWRDVVLGIALAVNGLAFVLACKWGPAANAIVLVYAAPVYSALLARFRRDSALPWFYWPALCCVLGGVFLMVADEFGTADVKATAAGTISGLALALWGEFRKTTSIDGGDRGLFFAGCAVLLLTTPVFISRARGLDFHPLTLGGIAVYAAMIIVAYLLFSRAVHDIPPAAALLVTAAEVPLMALWVYLGTGELPGPRALFGGVLIFVVATALSWAVTVRRTRAKHDTIVQEG